MGQKATFKLELKNIKHSEFASHETNCFNAVVYLDGKPFAGIENDGQGGSDLQYRHPKCGLADFHAKLDEVNSFLRNIDEKYNSKFVSPLEIWCGDQLEYHLSLKRLRRLLKTKVLGKKEGSKDIYEWKPRNKATPLNAIIPQIKMHNPGIVILNELPEEEALKVFMEPM